MGRLRPSPAGCIASLALFVSLGGTTYAVTSLPRNSVGTQQLQGGAVTEADLSGAAVITPKIANGAVTGRKIKPATITGSRIAPDTLGGAQIDESGLSAVPLALDAERAKVAVRATTADHVDHVGLVERARNADNAAVAEAIEAVETIAEDVVLVDDDNDRFFASCEPGRMVVGGGFLQLDDPGDVAFMAGSAPVNFETWAVDLVDVGPDTAEPIVGEVYALCVRAGPG